MKLQQTIEPGELFYRFYKKRIASFLANIYKAGITAGNEDIHKARVDLKKILALFSFFQLLEGSGLKTLKYKRLFRPVFKQAGKIREAQMNLSLLELYPVDMEWLKSYKAYLIKEQRKNTESFISVVIGFDEQRLKSIDNAVKKYCKEIEKDQLIKRSEEFIEGKAEILKFLSANYGDPENVHKIRQELKMLGAIGSLLLMVQPDPRMDDLLVRVNITEVMIGEWHDHIIFLQSLDQFRKTAPALSNEFADQFFRFRNKIEADNSRRLDITIPMVIEVVSLI